MRRRSKSFLLACLLFTGLTTVAIDVCAQDPPTDPCNTPGNPDVPPVYCPIDGGLAFLLLAGVGYGIGKHRSSQRKNETKTIQ